MKTVPLHVVDTTVVPPLMTKKEKETETHMMDNTKTPQKDEGLPKVAQMVAQSLQQQIFLGMCTADMSQQHTDALIGELIKSHNRRDIDHVLNNTPTFNGLEPEKSMDWVPRIRNACEQLNIDFRQELMNKSELMVQNFKKGLETDISDDEIINRFLGFFSDIPTPYHVMDKIKSIRQNDELMPQFSQKYRTYIERLERKAVNNMTSHTQMELYMSTINPHIAKALRTNIHYGSRYTTTSVGDAMKKVEECYLKDLYGQAGLEKDREQGNADREVTCAVVNTRGISGSQVEKDKEPGHHRRIKRTETSQDTRDYMIGGTGKIIQKIECKEILPEVTEMQRQKR